jgi:hypothetical protein
MFKFWGLVIEPMLRAIGAKRLLEIGVDSGLCTRPLLDYCAETGGWLDYVDPEPCFDTVTATKQFGHLSQFHHCTSLEALPKIETPDIALIDGDHNWYTVYSELKLLAAGATASGKGFPLVLFHDVSWPYGRRDMYYAPGRVPAAEQRPHRQKGMTPGVTRLVESGGLNAQLDNALDEGGPKNGVLTGIEDFVAESKVGTLHVFPALFGLAVLVPDHLAAHEGLKAQVDHWLGAEGLRTLLALVEHERVTEYAYAQAELRRRDAEEIAHRAELARVTAERDRAGAVGMHLVAERDRTAAERDRLQAENARLSDECRRLHAELELIFQSHSWRLTGFVRTAGALLSGKSWHNGHGRNGSNGGNGR